MHAANAAQALRERAARLNERARARKKKQKQDAGPALAPAPVLITAFMTSLDPRDAVATEEFTTAPLAATVTVSMMAMLDALPRVKVTREGRSQGRPTRGSGEWGTDDIADRPETDVDDTDANRAGLRGHLEHGEAYGPDVTRVVMAAYPSGARRLIVAHGRLSAIHRAFPDRLAESAWSSAGVSRPRGSAWPTQMELFPLKLDA